MSWELASFLILGAVLLAGFAWYERSRPPSQVVALVAALAALAIAGRIAFAAFPNVKPTTDIVIFAGYALGGAPGFAVGALAALVSNFWFGQGPWTPWQMAGWGLCGVLGAALALGGRNVGRLTLAAVCGFAGIAYGALLNFSLMATYGGDLSLERFLVLEARAMPFDAAHAIGNVVFALIAGPAMVRMLVRFRERFEWRGRRRTPRRRCRAGAASRPARRRHRRLLLLAFGLPALAPARADASEVSRAAAWLAVGRRTATAASAPRPATTPGTAMTAWAMLGLEAAGRNPLDVASRRQDPGRLPARAASTSWRAPATSPARSSPSRAPGSTRATSAAANLVSRAARRSAATTAPTKAGRARTAFAVIALRTAGAGGGLDESLVWLRQGPERRRRLGRRAGLAEQRRRHRRRDAGARPTPRPPQTGSPTCARRSARTAASRSAATAPSTRSRPPGRSRGCSPPAATPPRSPRRHQRARLPRRLGRPTTATTATPSPATRPRSGSPARSWSPSPASPSRSPPRRAQPQPARSQAEPAASAPARPVPTASPPAPVDAGLGTPLAAGCPDPRPAPPAAPAAAPAARRTRWAPGSRRRRRAPPTRSRRRASRRRSPVAPARPHRRAASKPTATTRQQRRRRDRLGLLAGGLPSALGLLGPPRLDALALRALARSAATGGELRSTRMDVETAIRTRRTHKAFGPEPLAARADRGAARAGALGAEPPPHRALALPRRRARRRWSG